MKADLIELLNLGSQRLLAVSFFSLSAWVLGLLLVFRYVSVGLLLPLLVIVRALMLVPVPSFYLINLLLRRNMGSALSCLIASTLTVADWRSFVCLDSIWLNLLLLDSQRFGPLSPVHLSNISRRSSPIKKHDCQKQLLTLLIYSDY